MKKKFSRLDGAWMASALLIGAAMAAMPAHADPLDDQLNDRVLSRLSTDQELGVGKITVSSRNGLVRLRGNVPNTEAAKRAIQLAEATDGVRGVVVEFVADE